MQAFQITTLILVTFCDSVVVGRMLSENYTVRSDAGVKPSLTVSIRCGMECNVNANCAGFFIGSGGHYSMFEHGNPPITVNGKGAYYQKVPEQMPTLYNSALPAAGYPRSCLEVKIRDGKLNPAVPQAIDPDGEGGEDPISVTCTASITDDQLTFRTEISHNRREYQSWTGYQADKSDPQSYSVDITYNANNAQLHTLAANSKSCRMSANFKCKFIDFNSYRWVAYDGGWNPMNVGTTHCPPEVVDVVCQCSHQGSEWWAYDYGYFNDKSKFPVTAIIIGGIESLYTAFEILELGLLECEDTPTCTRAPTLLFTTKDTPEEEEDVSYGHGHQVVYNCFSGLRFPDGTTQKTLTCEKDQVWSGLMYTECVL